MIMLAQTHIWSVESIVGGCIAVIVAGMPAFLALLKIKELHVLVDGRLTQLLTMTEKAAHSAGREEGLNEYLKLGESGPEEAKIILSDAAERARILLSEAATKARIIVLEAEAKKEKGVE